MLISFFWGGGEVLIHFVLCIEAGTYARLRHRCVAINSWLCAATPDAIVAGIATAAGRGRVGTDREETGGDMGQPANLQHPVQREHAERGNHSPSDGRRRPGPDHYLFLFCFLFCFFVLVFGFFFFVRVGGGWR